MGANASLLTGAPVRMATPMTTALFVCQNDQTFLCLHIRHLLLVCPPVVLINGTGQIDFRPPLSRYSDLFCSWTIEAPPGKNVAFEVLRLTSLGYWCDRYVKVEISGGRSNGSSNDARTISICGDQPNNHRVVSIGNRLTVSFLRHHYHGTLRFQANYRITGIRS